MKRFFYISDDLDDLESLENQLEDKGIYTPQIHVLSRDDAEVERHHLHEVHDFMKKDVVHTTMRGALMGLGLAMLVIVISYASGLPDVVGWVPFIFLSLILLGFCTWEAGMWGIQEPNSRFRQFQEALQQGRHVFFVDIDPEQEALLKQVLHQHPKLEFAGTGSPAPRWIVMAQQKWREFVHWAP